MIGWRSRRAFRTEAWSPSVERFSRAHEWPPELDEDAALRAGVAALDPAARRELREVLTLPGSQRNALLHSLLGRVGTEPLCQLIAITAEDNVARLRMLRAIRDVS